VGRALLSLSLLAIATACFAQTVQVRQLPKRYRALVIRTDFDDQSAWEAAARAIQAPWELPNGQSYSAEFNFLEDRRLKDAGERDVLLRVPKNYAQDFILIVDREALSRLGFPILVVSVSHEQQYGRAFRAIASEIPTIEASLFVANMDFHDFADAVDHDGVFRGFPRPAR
jgi:hypothetical protein